jgi:hypothetical protein
VSECCLPTSQALSALLRVWFRDERTRLLDTSVLELARDRAE